jgi:predicted FMN-binding regulatory protein PaiB
MYIPPLFRESDPDFIKEFLQRRGHMSRENPQWRTFDAENEVS